MDLHGTKIMPEATGDPGGAFSLDSESLNKQKELSPTYHGSILICTTMAWSRKAPSSIVVREGVSARFDFLHMGHAAHQVAYSTPNRFVSPSQNSFGKKALKHDVCHHQKHSSHASRMPWSYDWYTWVTGKADLRQQRMWHAAANKSLKCRGPFTVEHRSSEIVFLYRARENSHSLP